MLDLDGMTIGELRAEYERLYGYPCRSRHRQYLVRKVAWRIQCDAEGGLTERAKRRAKELADEKAIRVMAPRGRK